MTVLPRKDIDYKYLEDIKPEPTVPIEILTGKYKSVRFCYGQVRIRETTEDGKGVLSFVYKVLEPNNLKEIARLKTDKTFNNLLGDILVSIMEEGLSDEPREDDTEIATLQRGVL